MNYLTHPEPVEAGWLSEPAMPSVGGENRGPHYRCTDCGWFGRGVEAFDHHAENHHRIELTYAPALGPVSFSCCSHKHKR